MLRFICLALLLPLAGYSQNPTLEISLAQQTLPAAGTSFHLDKLVDARADRSSIGGVYRGLENRFVPARFARPLEAELVPLLQQALPTGAATRPLVVRVHTLAVQESIGAMSETASAELVVDFLEPAGPDAYRLLLSAAELVESKGLDVTGKHANNIRQAVQQSLQRLGTLVPNAPAPAALLTWAQVQAGEEGTLPRFPVQLAPLQRGVYRSFEEFRQNTPTLAEGPFEIKRKPRKGAQWAGIDNVEAWYLELGPNQPRQLVRGGAWGVSDGETAYIFYRGHYFPLEPRGSHYAFTGVRAPDPGNALAGAVLGGVAGAALASAGTNQPQLYELRMASGRVVPSLQPRTVGGFATPDTAAVYVYRRADAAAPLQVLVDGKPAGTLGPDQYLALTWRDRRRDMTICLRSEGQETCHTFVPVFTTATYLLCTPGGAGAAPALQPVPAKEGVFRLKHIRARE